MNKQEKIIKKLESFNFREQYVYLNDIGSTLAPIDKINIRSCHIKGYFEAFNINNKIHIEAYFQNTNLLNGVLKLLIEIYEGESIDFIALNPPIFLENINSTILSSAGKFSVSKIIEKLNGIK